MSSCSCVKCTDICRCIVLRSSEHTLTIDKDGCEWDINLAEGLNSIITASFDDASRQLCLFDRGNLTSCVTIPDDDDQYLELNGTILSIRKIDGTLVNSVNLSGLIPAETPFVLNSQSLLVTPGGAFGHTPTIELVPSGDNNNILILGSDGRPYVPAQIDKDVNIVNIQGLSFIKNVTSNSITFTPVLDYVYIASQVCPLCVGPLPCNPLTINVSNILPTQFTLTVSGLNPGDDYDVSLDGGTTWSILNEINIPIVVSGLTPNTTYTIVTRTNCASSQTALSAPYIVTTAQVACPPPTNLSIVMS